MGRGPLILDAPTIHEIVSEMKRAGLYLRVSQDSQTTENQRRILMEVAERSGWTVVEVFEDAGFSGAKGRDKRPAFDALLIQVAEPLSWTASMIKTLRGYGRGRPSEERYPRLNRK